MESLSTGTLFIFLGILLLLSAFFSSSETGMMSLNRYRLRHQAKQGNRKAKKVSEMLKRPDKLLGLILLGNNIVNILASAIATVIAIRFWGEGGIFAATLMLTFVVLIFAEVTPKTLAALFPERIAFFAAPVLNLLAGIFYPAVKFINFLSNGLLRLFGVKADEHSGDQLSRDELRSVVNEAGPLIPSRHQTMLLSILDLENVTVDDIMVPRNEIAGIDLNDDIDYIFEQIRTSIHTRLLVFRGDMDQVQGFLHARNFGRVLETENPKPEKLLDYLDPIYYVPEGTPLHTQLMKFQRKRDRIGLVVDEYGDVEGLVTLDDILEEIVGDFTTEMSAINKEVQPQLDGSILVDASITIRDLNRTTKWELPTEGPKTLNGLITEYMETIPQSGTCLRLHGYPLEVLQVKGNLIKSVRIIPSLYKT
ncbi:HlyC/CorC family transporter [Kangiella sp. TOML190]|uniref:HlyC/CorC family transporter n=1 Tax=Kangiella sp. TOML190 TaxID=2931351 RepID=UPI00203C60E4|nr:HlyC/CorC family transporter [Kangiella sp. TOML190]